MVDILGGFGTVIGGLLAWGLIGIGDGTHALAVHTGHGLHATGCGVRRVVRHPCKKPAPPAGTKQVIMKGASHETP